jgi:putative PIN family toxin of toxin-antitoxin system
MRVVLDTNVVISAALRDRDPEAVVLYVVRTPGVQWLATPPMVEEYLGVLRRPRLALGTGVLEKWDGLISAAVLVVESVPPVSWSGDPGDAIFVACASGVDADFLITGDRGILGAGRLGRTLVVTVSQFKRSVCDARA